GWYHTGDLGVWHPDGYVEVKDRSKDIIISGGENISSLEVEECLYRHPRVVPRAPRALQGAAHRRLRRAAEDLHGEDPEVRAAGAGARAGLARVFVRPVALAGRHAPLAREGVLEDEVARARLAGAGAGLVLLLHQREAHHLRHVAVRALQAVGRLRLAFLVDLHADAHRAIAQ